MPIPEHEHHVDLTLFHSELNAAYGLRPGFALSLRIPYDVKDQRVHYTTLSGDAFTPPYGDIHHRSETLRGISDGDLLLLWAPATSGASRWLFAIGTTLPFGRTVEDPVALGREGKEHEHLQFGNGLFAPQAEIAWSRPVHNASLSSLVQATIPLSTNDRGFRPPRNFRWSIGPSIPIRGTTVALSAAGQYQSIGRWNGEVDEGTGFVNGGLRLSFTFPLSRVSIAPSIYRELYSRGLNHHEDETFSQGTTLGLTIARTF